MMKEPLLGFYSRLYRCEDCKEIGDPHGVYYFVGGKGISGSPEYLPPTIPVSHFGDITNSKIWVVTTNPKGDRDDPLVGQDVYRFGVSSRSSLKESDIKSIFKIQCNYFRDNNRKWHPFFLTFVKLLDGIRFGQQNLSFQSGDVCFVDAIKCPTEVTWGSFVRSDEGKKVWDNCLRIKNRFLPRQLEIHKPRIVLYYGTGSLIKVHQKGKKVGESTGFSNGLKLQTRHLYSKGCLKRISIEFSRADLRLPGNELKDVRNYISKEVNLSPENAHKITKETEADVAPEFRAVFPYPKNRAIGNMIERKLMKSEYRKMGRNHWIKGKRVVHIVRSSESGRRIRIMWREEWKDDHAIVYDYSGARGPICVVPVSVLFMSDFVKEKRKSGAYANSGYWWSQTFPRDRELARLVLSFEGQWDIL